jgi:hypothetical protein
MCNAANIITNVDYLHVKHVILSINLTTFLC